jgi:hypothetical protein
VKLRVDRGFAFFVFALQEKPGLHAAGRLLKNTLDQFLRG